MQIPEKPSNEEARLKTLHDLHILDTEFDERFDRLTRMAARMFDVPIALVSLVDTNRQWFKSSFGLEARETPRDISFCGHTILQDDAFVINDASMDSRFSDNPLVTSDPNIRFYAGCPLQITEGNRIGTLCIIDDQPREFAIEDVELLKDLAYMVQQEMRALHIATVDELTRLSNRRGFMMLAQHSLNVCMRQSTNCTLVFLDMDKFKEINDSHGHEEGDKALLTFAEQLQLRFRESDVVARLGGDEFVLLLTNTDLQKAHEAVFAFQRNLENVVGSKQLVYPLLFSYGAIQFDAARHKTVEDMLRESDNLMYEAKRKRLN